MRRAVRDDGLQAFVPSDSVLDMDHEILRREVGRVRDEVLCAPPSRPGQALAEDVLLAHDQKVRRLEALFDPQDRESRPVGRQVLDFRPAPDRDEAGDPVLREQLPQTLPRARGPGGDDDTGSLAPAGLQRAADAVEYVPVLAVRLGRRAGKGRRPPSTEIRHRIEGALRHVLRRVVRPEIAQPSLGQQPVPRPGVQVEAVGR